MTRSIVIPGSHFATQVLRRPTLSAFIHDQEAWTKLQTLIARADAELQRRRDLPPIQGTTPDAVADKALRAGGELPVGFGKDAAGAAAEAETRKVELASLTRLRGGYVQELGVLVEESIPDMISALNADLQRVLDVAEEALTELDGNIDPLAAIKAKKSQSFAVLAEAHTDYLAIRANADLILQEQDSALRESAGWHRLMAGVARCWPAWYSTDRESPMTGWSRVDGAPWPADEESLEFLIWVVQTARSRSRGLLRLRTSAPSGALTLARRRKRSRPATPWLWALRPATCSRCMGPRPQWLVGTSDASSPPKVSTPPPL